MISHEKRPKLDNGCSLVFPDGVPRAVLPNIRPVCVVYNTPLSVRVRVPDGLHVKLALYSTYSDQSTLRCDPLALLDTIGGLSERFSGPVDTTVMFSWKNSLTSVSHVKGSDKSKKTVSPIVFAIALCANDSDELLCRTEGFFLLSTTRDRKVENGSKLLKWISENCATLIDQFGISDPTPKIQHKCADFAEMLAQQSFPPCCRMAFQQRGLEQSLPELLPLQQENGPMDQSQMHEAVLPEVENLFDGLSDDDTSLWSMSFDVFPPSPEPVFSSAPEALTETLLNPRLVQDAGLGWALVGREWSSGMCVVKPEAVLGIRVCATQSVKVTIHVTDTQRNKRSFAPKVLDDGVAVLPLPRPARAGMEIVDVSANNEPCVSIPYLVKV